MRLRKALSIVKNRDNENVETCRLFITELRRSVLEAVVAHEILLSGDLYADQIDKLGSGVISTSNQFGSMALRTMVLALARVYESEKKDRACFGTVFKMLDQSGVGASLISDLTAYQDACAIYNRTESLASLSSLEWSLPPKSGVAGSKKKASISGLRTILRDQRNAVLAHNLPEKLLDLPSLRVRDVESLMDNAEQVVGALGKATGMFFVTFASDRTIWRQRSQEYFERLALGNDAAN